MENREILFSPGEVAAMSNIGSNATQTNGTVADAQLRPSAVRTSAEGTKAPSRLLRVALLAVAASGLLASTILGGCSTRDDGDGANQAVTAGPGAGIVISQVYSTGGAAPDSTFKNDFVELFNASATEQSLDGLTLQFALRSVDGGTPSSVGVVFEADGGVRGNLILPLKDVLPAESLKVPPGGYVLLGFSGTGNPGGGQPLPVNDMPAADGGLFTYDLPTSAGTVALVRGADALNCGGPSGPCSSASPRVVDLVGYGSAAGAAEGAPVVGFDQTKSVARTDRCQDHDDNKADFAPATPTPHGKSTPPAPCAAPPAGDAAATTDTSTPPPAVDAGTPPKVVISQVYAGGGEPGAPYRRDYIEIFNPTADPQNLVGMSAQFASADGTLGEGGQLFPFTSTMPSYFQTLAPGARLAIILGGSTAGNGVDYPITYYSRATVINLNVPVDANGVPTSSRLDLGKAGKVALVFGTTALGCGSAAAPCKADPAKASALIDYVGFGNDATVSMGKASEFEGSGPTPVTDATHAVLRGDACADANDNGKDFGQAFPSPQTLMFTAPKCGQKLGGDGLVISQFYTAGGLADSEFNRDFVEIFNRSAFDQDLTGLAIVYGRGDGQLGANGVNGGVGIAEVSLDGKTMTKVATGYISLPPFTMKPGTYMLIGLGGPLNGRGEDVPFTWGVTSSIGAPLDLDTNAGKIALMRGALPLNCGPGRCNDKAHIIDMVAYGAQTNDYDGPAAAAGTALDPTKVIVRKDNGCVDTGDNGQDFVVQKADHRFVHNTGSNALDCANPTGKFEEGSGTYPTAGGNGSKVIEHGDAGPPSNGASGSDSGCAVSSGTASDGARIGGLGLFVGLALALKLRRRRRSA